MKLHLKPPPVIEKKFNESDTARRIAEANNRMHAATAGMESLQWDENGELIEVKCGNKPPNGKPEPEPA